MPKVNREFNQAEYTRQFQKEHYYRMNIVMPKEFRPVVDQAAAAAGMSKNAFILEAIKEKIERLENEADT